MKKTKFRAYLRRLIILALILLAMLSVAVGRYMTTIEAGGGTVTVNARLANSLAVQESKAVRQADGTYKLDDKTIVNSNEYYLIPGVDIPKNPYVVIEGKTPIPAHLYLTVQNVTNEAITYELHDCWVRQGSSNTYVYCADGTTPTEITADPDQVIYILKDNKVYVKQTLLGGGATDPLSFTVNLKEVVG